MFRKKEDVPATDGVRRVAATELEVNNASRDGVYAFSIAVFLVSFAVVFALTWVWFSPVTVAVSLAVAFLCVSSVPQPSPPRLPREPCHFRIPRS